MKLGLLQHQVGRHGTLDAWRAALDERLGEAARAGVELAVMPEYACLDAVCEMLPDVRAERDRAVERHEAVMDALRALAKRHGLWLLAGSLLVARADRVVNAAPLITPDGRVAWQDKHRTTRFEAEQWGLARGAQPAVFSTPWGRIGVCVCYDIEHPPLARAQVEAGAWLILVPAATDTAAGFNRVQIAARAAAMSNQCYVAVCTTVGDAPWIASLDLNRGQAGVYGPMDRGFADDGVVAQGEMDRAGWLIAEIAPAALDLARHGGAVLNHRDYPARLPTAPVIDLCR